jgi:predicted dehydrogenase
MKLAVLGLGSAGRRHTQLLLELGHEVIGFDPDASAPEGGESAGSAEQAMELADAVIVASPSSLHAEHALAALERKKPTLIEKPLATTSADAERIARTAEDAGVTCGVAMNLRFHPGILALKRLVETGELGNVRFARASFGYDLRLWHPKAEYRHSYSARADLGGGIVLDAIHEIDYLLWLLGPVSSVSAEAAHASDLEIDVEDVAVAALRFESGALGSVDLNFFEPVYRRGCIIVGANAVAQWDWGPQEVTVSQGGGDELVVDVSCDLASTYRAELIDFAGAVESVGKPRTPAREGLDALRVAESIKVSSSLGRRVSINE